MSIYTGEIRYRIRVHAFHFTDPNTMPAGLEEASGGRVELVDTTRRGTPRKRPYLRWVDDPGYEIANVGDWVTIDEDGELEAWTDAAFRKTFDVTEDGR